MDFSADAPTLARALFNLLEVERLDTDLFRGGRDEFPDGRPRIFGGQVVAQALASAAHSVEAGRAPHSLHAYFVRAGDVDAPVIYKVERDHDGRSFSNRRVVATQHGKTILNMIASFHIEEEGFSHQDEMPDVPQPEDLRSDAEVVNDLENAHPKFRAWMSRPRPIEIRRVNARMIDPEPAEPLHHMWFRAAAPVTGDQMLHRAVLAYASDMALLGTAMMPHGVNWITPGLRSASIDHALWFHAPTDLGEWHLYTTRSPWAGGARGYNTGSIFRRDGTLVASVAQEGLIRMKDRES